MRTQKINNIKELLRGDPRKKPRMILFQDEPGSLFMTRKEAEELHNQFPNVPLIRVAYHDNN
ncbi:MAG: hypothetical protein WAW07_09690 [Bacteroidales bacterium]